MDKKWNGGNQMRFVDVTTHMGLCQLSLYSTQIYYRETPFKVE